MSNTPLNFKILHGGDYNPDQWLDRPDILEKDIILMKEAHINCVSVGIFSWTKLEPEDGVYTFDWLKNVIDSLYENGIYTILATPSGSRPAWMAKKYPEVLRVENNLVRNSMGVRHNHCYTSPVYRKKVWDMNYNLSKKFGSHEGVILWHLSNEYSGECFCPLCQEAFRQWLKDKYKTLDKLNYEWNTSFWSHIYTSWEEIEAPIPKGEMGTHCLNLDWKRFVTDQTVDFAAKEKEAIRAAGSILPITTNLMGFYHGLNYFKFKDILDIVSWDNYPDWNHFEDDVPTAIETACTHDLMRSIKRESFLMMESTPSTVNWRPISHLKRPGIHMLSSLQAVAHGSNSIQYFQWRKSRGNTEKFHGAVVDHYGESDTRVFQEVKQLGQRLEHLDAITQSQVKPEVAIIFDIENRWAVQDACGPRTGNIHYQETMLSHYQAFWNMGVPVDLIDMEQDITNYKLIAAPMLYLYRADIETKLKTFVKNGGTLVGTYWSGIVNESDLCFLGGTPGNMMDVFGLRSEEIDALYDNQSNRTTWNYKTYEITELCDIVKLKGAIPFAFYETDFYVGSPVLTYNTYGDGTAYYIAAKLEDNFYQDFYCKLVSDCSIQKSLDGTLPYGVTANIRKGDRDIIIVQNYNAYPAVLSLNKAYKDFETEEVVDGKLSLEPYEVRFVTEL